MAVVRRRVVRRIVVYRVPLSGRSVAVPFRLRQRLFPGWFKFYEGQITPVTGVATNAIGAIMGMCPAISVVPAPTTGNGPETIRLMVVAAVITPFANRDSPTVIRRWEHT